MLITGALTAQQPDYYKPYAPISFDKEIYSWTDKVRITIVSPAWNSNVYAIDTIGEDSQFPIKIDRKSTRLNSSHISESRMPSSA